MPNCYAVREKRSGGTLRLYGYTATLADAQLVARALNRHWSFTPNAFAAYNTPYPVPKYWSRSLRQVVLQGGLKPRPIGYFVDQHAIAVSSSLNSELRQPYSAMAEGENGAPRIAGIERKSPLPKGRYWQDIFEKQASDWNAWLAPNLQSGAVQIVKVERFKSNPLQDGSWLPEPLQPDNAGTIPARMWVLFDVVTPVAWPAVQLGFPTIADKGVTTSDDTAQNPPGPSIPEEIGTAAAGLVKPIVWGVAIALGLAVFSHTRKS
jgi:hypothetical protein